MSSILVLEDNLTFRQMLVESLNDEFPDIQILEAGEGKEALRIVDELRPFLVFMDIRLPGENGLNLTRRIKTDHPDTAVVMLTAYDLPEYREAARKFGAGGYIVKGSSSVEGILDLLHSMLAKGTGAGND